MILERLTPRFLEKVWGVERLDPWFSAEEARGIGGKTGGSKIGEVWFERSEPLPVLVKFVFTSEKLSVQVHPHDEYAARHHGSRGKTEMWYVLAAEPGARIAAGLREPVSREHLREAALSGEIENLLAWYEASPGDTFFIPAGTVHAIGPGLAMCEIQQNCDLTYRLYDYGRPRELHLEHALAVSHTGPHAPRRQPQATGSGGELLVACEYFTATRHAIKESSRIETPPDEFRLLVVTEGTGTAAGRPVRAGEVWYVPPESPPVELTGCVTVLAVRAKP
jgi:mannose-6-phosphate isomerase